MSQDLDYELKQAFREYFPEEAKRLETATSQEELVSIHQELYEEAVKKLDNIEGIQSHASSRDKTAPILLDEKKYNRLINARGNGIKEEVHVLLDGLARLKEYKDEGNEFFAIAMVTIGVLGLGSRAIKAVLARLAQGAVTGIAGVLAGIEAVGKIAIIGLVTLVVIGILVPIIYFMVKPAACIVCLINETDEELVFNGDHNVHGKPVLRTSPLAAKIVYTKKNGKKTAAYTAGLVTTIKCDSACIGTQYCFGYDNTPSQKLTYALENQLSAM